jgi:integrase
MENNEVLNQNSQPVSIFDLKEAVDRGIINQTELLSQLEMSRKTDILSKHKFNVWQNEKTGFWYTYLPDETRKDGRRLIKKKDKAVIEETIYQFYKTQIDDPTVNEVFLRWLESKQNIYSQTAMRYESTFRKYIEPTAFGQKKMRNVTFKDLNDFCLNTVGKNKMKAKCWASIRTDLLGLIKYAKIEGFSTLSTQDVRDIDIGRNVFIKTCILPGEDVFTKEDITKLKAYISEHMDDIELLGALLALKTGLRVGELCSLKYSDFDFKNMILTVLRTEAKIRNTDPEGGTKTTLAVRENTKGADGWRQVAIDKEVESLVKQIYALSSHEEYLFEIDGRRICANCWTKKIPKLCKKLGIGKVAENGEYSLDKSMHKFRKYYISSLLHNGALADFVAQQVGHKDVQTTFRNYNRGIESLEERRDALTPLLEKL